MCKFKYGAEVVLLDPVCGFSVGEEFTVVAFEGASDQLVVGVNSKKQWITAHYFRFKEKEEEEETMDIYELINNLPNPTLKTLKKFIEKKLETKVVVLYSVNGQRWGKKRLSNSRFKQTYKLQNGQIIGDVRVEKI